MMRGIKLKHGVIFVEYDGITVRVNTDGKCELSPVILSVLEWDLRCEPPQTWMYISDADIDSLGNDVRQQIIDIVTKVRQTLGE